MIFGGRMGGEIWLPLAFADVRWHRPEPPHEANSAGRNGVSVAKCGCPRQDSNLRSRLRRPLLSPLSYGGVRAK